MLYSCKRDQHELYDFKSERLSIVKVGEHTFMHTSYLQTEQYGDVPCNGMIYINGNVAIVFDTPVNDAASIELINWLEDYTIKAVIATHFHVDCLGGLGAFHKKNIPSFALDKTIELAHKNEAAYLPQNEFEKEQLFKIGTELVIARYFGEGHTPDNVVGYIPSEEILFGGCLLKAQGAPTGNLADANVAEWSQTVEKVKSTYPNIKIVIPGHGTQGNEELLDYTINLFKPEKRYLFFLHNRFLETHDLDDIHPEYGRTELPEIVDSFEKAGLTIISEQRNGNVNARVYATTVVEQIDSLIANGITASNITVAGTSKGGYIAQYVSTLANRPDLNFVFIASYQESDLQNIPEINFCGNILNIYERSDHYNASAKARLQHTTCKVKHFKEIELNTGLGHGFLFRPMKEWVKPTISWAKGDYINP